MYGATKLPATAVAPKIRYPPLLMRLFSLDLIEIGVNHSAGARVTIAVKKSGFTLARIGLETLGISPEAKAAPTAVRYPMKTNLVLFREFIINEYQSAR